MTRSSRVSIVPPDPDRATQPVAAASTLQTIPVYSYPLLPAQSSPVRLILRLLLLLPQASLHPFLAQLSTPTCRTPITWAPSLLTPPCHSQPASPTSSPRFLTPGLFLFSHLG